MKKFLITLVIVFSCMAGYAQEKPKFIKGFSGGMMVHTGYLNGSDNPFGYDAAGATFGIGGVAKLNLSEHFRVGFEGYVSTMGLEDDVVKDGSYNKVFWTGLLCDWFWKVGRFYPYAGCTVGGGMETVFYMFDGNKDDWEIERKTVFNKQPFFAVDPFAGVDYQVGKAMRLTLKFDYLLAMNAGRINRPLGPRVYFGFIFVH